MPMCVTSINDFNLQPGWKKQLGSVFEHIIICNCVDNLVGVEKQIRHHLKGTDNWAEVFSLILTELVIINSSVAKVMHRCVVGLVFL